MITGHSSPSSIKSAPMSAALSRAELMGYMHHYLADPCDGLERQALEAIRARIEWMLRIVPPDDIAGWYARHGRGASEPSGD